MIYTEAKKVEKHKETIQTVMEFCEYLQNTGTFVNETDVFDWLKIDHDKYHEELEHMAKIARRQ